MRSITMYNVYGDSQRAEASDASRAPRLYRATDIMNTRVENFSNESIGTISDFAIQGRTGRVVYGVLSRGGFLGIGESLYAVPTEELANYKNDKLTVGFDTEVLDSFNGFDDDNWPLQSNLQWTSNPVEANDNKHEVYEVVKASEVVGETLKTREGEDVGTISDRSGYTRRSYTSSFFYA